MENLTPNMKRTDASIKSAHSTESEPSLKGTFASVMMVGAFLLVSWLGVFLLFLARS